MWDVNLVEILKYTMIAYMNIIKNIYNTFFLISSYLMFLLIYNSKIV